MKSLFRLTAAAVAVAGAPAFAVTVTPTFTQVAIDTTTAQQSAVFQADLTGFAGLTEIGSITVTDTNGTSGSAGAYSGFDIDALFIDMDGDYLTTG
eukprot:CAMPEP_0181242890 /NCGR_PEP_ID=MMETSP1096-20121128/41948_1 /TAXON_ID=156174 ORGANISM="Chrysochromulina ericina, Strain CCMP281" /NCGR_SAMPLE_ID=MMETSP1096 /ASSEMBLY_ACC=CAM_ASM_000453 /LENGTH=95 /DNA_ID=CAMNT_0023339163 /DNA_START=72 /DNA_END=355 /DNA_ORIENTATION=-